MFAPPPAAVASAPIAFAPPLGEVLTYETRETHGRVVLAMTHAVTFERQGAGYRLTATQTGHAADGPAGAQAIFAATMTPMDGVPVAVTVGRGGAIGAPIDAASAWAKVIAGQARAQAVLDARPGLSPAVRAAARAALAQAGMLDAAARDAALTDWAGELLGFVAADLPAGGEARIEAGALAGRVRLARIEGRLAHYVVDLAGPPADGATLARRDEVAVDRMTGLIEARRSTTTIAAPDAPADVSVRTLRRLRAPPVS